jgi:hypothetical protein
VIHPVCNVDYNFGDILLSFRLVFSSNKEDILGRHDAPVRCVEYSYAAGLFL